MSERKHRSGWSYAGEGIMWALIWLSFASCVCIVNREDKGPLIVIQK